MEQTQNQTSISGEHILTEEELAATRAGMEVGIVGGKITPDNPTILIKLDK